MKTLTLQTVIPADGTLRLEVPTDLPAGLAEVVLVVQPNSPQASTVSSLSGIFQGQIPPNIDVVEEIREIRRRSSQEALELPE